MPQAADILSIYRPKQPNRPKMDKKGVTPLLRETYLELMGGFLERAFRAYTRLFQYVLAHAVSYGASSQLVQNVLFDQLVYLTYEEISLLLVPPRRYISCLNHSKQPNMPKSDQKGRDPSSTEDLFGSGEWVPGARIGGHARLFHYVTGYPNMPGMVRNSFEMTFSTS